MFLSKILTHICMIIRCTMEENNFVIIDYTLLVQKKILKQTKIIIHDLWRS